MQLDAVLSFLVALAIAAALTPLAARLARRVGAVDVPRERGLALRETPLLGGLAILAGVLVASAIWLPSHGQPGARRARQARFRRHRPHVGRDRRRLPDHARRRDRRRSPAAAGGQADRTDRRGGDRGRGGSRGDRDHDPVHRRAAVPQRGRGADRHLAGRDDERGQLLRRGRRAGGGRLHDRRHRVRDHRLRSRRQRRRRSWPR